MKYFQLKKFILAERTQSLFRNAGLLAKRYGAPLDDAAELKIAGKLDLKTARNAM